MINSEISFLHTKTAIYKCCFISVKFFVRFWMKSEVVFFVAYLWQLMQWSWLVFDVDGIAYITIAVHSLWINVFFVLKSSHELYMLCQEKEITEELDKADEELIKSIAFPVSIWLFFSLLFCHCNLLLSKSFTLRLVHEVLMRVPFAGFKKLCPTYTGWWRWGSRWGLWSVIFQSIQVTRWQFKGTFWLYWLLHL